VLLVCLPPCSRIPPQSPRALPHLPSMSALFPVGKSPGSTLTTSLSFPRTSPMDYAHFVRQLRFVVPGGAATYWLGTTDKIQEIWSNGSGLARCANMLVSSAWRAHRLQTTLRYICRRWHPHDHAFPIRPTLPRDQGRLAKRASYYSDVATLCALTGRSTSTAPGANRASCHLLYQPSRCPL
jgi:hypothetical protein